MDWKKEGGLYLGLEKKEKPGWPYYNALNLSAYYLGILCMLYNFQIRIFLFICFQNLPSCSGCDIVSKIKWKL